MIELSETLSGITAELLTRMGFDDFDIAVESVAAPDPQRVAIAMREGRFLIGRGGENLQAFEHLLRVVVARRLGAETPAIVCDVNNYRRERAEYLRLLARQVAQRVKLGGRSVSLRPMSAFERRIIHVELATRPDITTESQGEGVGRRIVVHPYRA